MYVAFVILPIIYVLTTTVYSLVMFCLFLCEKIMNPDERVVSQCRIFINIVAYLLIDFPC
jgi:hypothetical protein